MKRLMHCVAIERVLRCGVGRLRGCPQEFGQEMSITLEDGSRVGNMGGGPAEPLLAYLPLPFARRGGRDNGHRPAGRERSESVRQ